MLLRPPPDNVAAGHANQGEADADNEVRLNGEVGEPELREDQQVRCEVQFDGNVDCTKMKTILKRACFMYMEFSDFHREIPMAIAEI